MTTFTVTPEALLSLRRALLGVAAELAELPEMPDPAGLYDADSDLGNLYAAWGRSVIEKAKSIENLSDRIEDATWGYRMVEMINSKMMQSKENSSGTGQ